MQSRTYFVNFEKKTETNSKRLILSPPHGLQQILIMSSDTMIIPKAAKIIETGFIGFTT